jgi:asparagine synthase (glutamine-hydrolysing)
VHTRLAIIDEAGGAQPMEDERGVLIFNGEIYNYADLRDPAVAYRTRSDTEVLLKGLNREGVGYLDKLDGMYALAYLDKRTRRILLAREIRSASSRSTMCAATAGSPSPRPCTR